MKTYKYTDSTNQIVHIIDEDGISRSSCLVSILEPGTDILPADPEPAVIPIDPVAKLQAFLAANPDVAALLQ